ncbi:MAG: DUF11 domain-containing protein, partial [Anaerolineae bacterium]|nr:DUF11 domain-containing protein [Anaerolineae bacterium]
VTWSGTGVVAGRLAPTTGSSTIFTAGETGTGTIHADDGSGHTDDTGTITVSDLTVSKIDLPDPVPAGGELTYIINYQNGVTSPAEDVIITETYDSRVTFVSATLTPTMGTNNVWDIGGLYVGQSGNIVVTVRVDTPLPDGSTLTNRVTIDSAHTSPQTYTETTGVSAPDLAIAAAHEPSLFSPAKLMTYTLSYSNTGHWQAEGVIITTTLPPDTTYAGHGWISSDDQTYIYVVGDLPADASDQAYFVVRYPDQPQIGAAEFNTPFVISESGSRGDANQANNTTWVYIGVPDLIVTDFTVEPFPLQADVPVTFTIVLENQGTGMAWNPDNETGFFVDVFIAPVVSYPFVRWSDIFTSADSLAPGHQHTLVITHSGFSEQEIREEIEGFYVKVDNYADPIYDEEGRIIGWTRLYGIVPEHNEMNNLFNPWSYYAYLP